ncbi:MAG: histidine kinase [Prevotellaceae bacterium]|jgi:hypothetical protein|nr:histidine kinase [Prevotellaceae bacterium]
MKQKTIAEPFVHVLLWVVMFCLPPLFSYLNGEHTDRALQLHTMRMLPNLPSYMLIFYLNYFWLTERLLFSKNLPQFILINLTCIVVLVPATSVLQQYFFSELAEQNFDHLNHLEHANHFDRFDHSDHFDHFNRPSRRQGFAPHMHSGPSSEIRFIISATMHLMVVGAAVAIKATVRSYRMQSQIDALETAKSEAELQQLKSQLNPHFLFNSLNNIYALIAFDQSRAQLAMHNLSDMLRYQLYEANKKQIPLRKELEFMRDYCDLMKLRMPANVRVELDFPRNNESSDVDIAPLLFITLVENAFKHGVSPTAPSHICIAIEATSGHVRCAVRNSCFPRTDAPCSESGIGLANLRKRLDLLYPTRYTWNITATEEEYASVLTIEI